MTNAAMNDAAIHDDGAQEITYEEVIECLVSAENGDKIAQHLCGKLYYHGLIVEQDYHQALYWFEKSVEKAIPARSSITERISEAGKSIEKDSIAANDQRYEESSKMVSLLYSSLFVITSLFSDLTGGSENSLFL